MDQNEMLEVGFGVTYMSLCQDEDAILMGHADGTLIRYSLVSGSLYMRNQKIKAHLNKITCIKPIGETIHVATGACHDNTIILWDHESMEQLARMNC